MKVCSIILLSVLGQATTHITHQAPTHKRYKIKPDYIRIERAIRQTFKTLRKQKLLIPWGICCLPYLKTDTIQIINKNS